jgi:hypothetical protein
MTRVDRWFGVGLHYRGLSRRTEQRGLGPDLELAGDRIGAQTSRGRSSTFIGLHGRTLAAVGKGSARTAYWQHKGNGGAEERLTADVGYFDYRIVSAVQTDTIDCAVAFHYLDPNRAFVRGSLTSIAFLTWQQGRSEEKDT